MTDKYRNFGERLGLAQRHLRRISLGIAFALLILPVSAADWRQELQDQLLQDKNCAVEFYTDIRERMVEGALIVIARAHCTDKRAFDATRTGLDKPFRLIKCQPAAC